MREVLLTLGDGESLVATATLPYREHDGRVFVFLNAGLVPRQGPHRNHVKWCRTLASYGAVAIRVDLAGIGDSAPRTAQPGSSPGMRHLADVSLVLDWIFDNYNAPRIYLCGTCLGAAHSWNAFVSDSRIAGALLVDAWSYHTWRSRLMRLPLTLRRSPLFQRLVRVLLRRPAPAAGAQAAQPGWVAIPAPTSAAMRQSIKSCSVSGRQLKFIYTRTWSKAMRYDAQLSAALGTEVDCERWLDANHTLTLPYMQQRLADTLHRWAR